MNTIKFNQGSKIINFLAVSISFLAKLLYQAQKKCHLFLVVKGTKNK